MDDFRKIAKSALDDVKSGNKGSLNESRISYPENMNERMHPNIERALRERKTSLGDHPIFPESDENTFEERIMGERFANVVNNYKRQFECDTITMESVIQNSGPLVAECMKMEYQHREALEELAIRMIREEYDIDEDDVEIVAELTHSISLEGTKKNPSPTMVEDMDFDSTESISEANGHVYKRRFLNAMTQGASMKGHHMFHMNADELSKLNPQLPRKYAKIMANVDYSQFLTSELNEGGNGRYNGGVSRVQLPTEENQKPSIHVQGMVFPVLIHELTKGVMEILSAHGFTDDEKLNEYMVAKGDFLLAEKDDQLIGPALWERFTRLFEADDFKYKHHVYSELASLPLKEFNSTWKEIMAGTKRGKKIITDIISEVKSDLQEEAYNEKIGGDDGDTFSLDDFRGINPFDL